MKFVLLTLSSLSLAISLASAQQTRGDTFTAAVVEDYPLRDETDFIDHPDVIREVHLKLEKLQNLTEKASQKGAKIIVFPENVLLPEGIGRSSMNKYLEEIPDSKTAKWNPCLDPSAYNGTKIQEKLSCIARQFKIYLVANMGKKEQCTHCTDSSCPVDCLHVYSSNVVYSDDGTFLGNSHKQTKLPNSPFERASKNDYVTFDTPFGKFASVTGFDLLFNKNMFLLLKKQKIRNFILPSEWPKMTPLFRSVTVYSMFARAHSVNLMVAGLQSLLRQKSGSGLFGPNSIELCNYEIDQEASGILLADMQQIKESSSPRPNISKMDLSIIPTKDFLQGVIMSLMFHFKPLQGREGSVGMCIATFCCSLKYERQQSNEIYALGIGNGYLQTDYARLYAQICTLSKCERPNNCVVTITKAETIFNSFTLSGHNYLTRDIGASVVHMNGTKYGFNVSDWIYNDTGQIFVEKTMTLPLHSAVLYSGIYEDKNENDLESDNSIQVSPNSFVLMTLATLLCV